MFRQLVGPVVMAVVVLPDWAAAFNDRFACCPPPAYPVVVSPAPCPPQFLPPPVVACPPVSCCPVAAAATVNPSTPTVVPERMQETPKKNEKNVQADPPAGGFAAPVAVESPVKPAAATEKEQPKDKIPPAAVPMTPTTPKQIDTPKPTADLPKFEIPPLREQPKQPGSLPPLDLPLPTTTDKPKADAPKADAPKPTAGLPAFDLTFPKDVAQPVEANKPSVSRSSPLNDERRDERKAAVVDVYPVAGAAPASALRTVGFVNKSDRDVLLTINGKMTTLPAKNVMRAELPASFKWQIGGEPEREQTVPAAAPGVDVVIRK